MFQPKIFPKIPKFSPGVPAVPAGFRDSVMMSLFLCFMDMMVGGPYHGYDERGEEEEAGACGRHGWRAPSEAMGRAGEAQPPATHNHSWQIRLCAMVISVSS